MTMMVFRREFWVKLLIFYLFCSNPIEARKQSGKTKGQFKPPMKAAYKEYGQVRRHSRSVYEVHEPLHPEWSTDNDGDNSWDNVHLSLDESMKQKLDDVGTSLPDVKGQFKPPMKATYKEYGQVRRHSRSVYEVHEPLHPEWSTDNDGDNSWDNVHLSLDESKKQKFDDVGFDRLKYTTIMCDFVLETLTTVTESITFKAKEWFKYVMEKGEDLFNYVTDDGIGFLQSWNLEFTKEIFANKANEVIAYITEVAANFASVLTIKEIPSFFNYLDISPVTTRINGLKDYGLDTVNAAAQFMIEFIESNIKNRFQRTSESVITMTDNILAKASNLFVYITEATGNSLSVMADTVSMGIADFIVSVGNSEFVLILNEEMIEPMHGSLTEIYHSCMCPLVDYITNAVFQNVSTMLNGTSRVVLKYAIKMKKLNDEAIVVTSSLINSGVDFVNGCNTKECLLSTAQSYIQDENLFYNIVWLIIYTIYTLLFLYFSYVSNKVTLQFCLVLIKVILKRVTCMFCCIFRCCKKLVKANPPMLVDSATYCDMSNIEVRVTESYYNKLIAASERKLQQLQQIRALAIELEELQCTNMAGYLEMYEKQGECDELEAQTAIENEFNDTETLSPQ